MTIKNSKLAHQDTLGGGSQLLFYVGSNKMMTLQDDPTVKGILHGTWESESTITTSDRRLKTNIQPIDRTLRELQNTRMESASAPSPTDGDGASAPTATVSGSSRWLLEHLRPVSYKKSNEPMGPRRYGFIAQDLEQVIPDVVHVDNGEQRMRSVRYQDFIAILTAVAQEQQRALAEQHHLLLDQQRARGELFMRMTHLERLVQESKVREVEANMKVSRLEALLAQVSSRLDGCCIV